MDRRQVNGATPVSDSALLSAGGELRFLNGWAIGGRFDGELADRAQTAGRSGTCGSYGSRTPIMGARPVRGRPRFLRLFGMIFG